MNQNAASLFLKLSHAIDNFGYDIVVGKIDEINAGTEIKLNKEIEAFIISESCKYFSVPKTEVIKSVRVSQKAIPARNMCIVLLKKHLNNHTDLEIEKIVKKDTHKTVEFIMSEFTKMNPKIKHEKEFLDAYEILHDKVNTFRVQIKLLKS